MTEPNATVTLRIQIESENLGIYKTLNTTVNINNVPDIQRLSRRLENTLALNLDILQEL